MRDVKGRLCVINNRQWTLPYRGQHLVLTCMVHTCWPLRKSRAFQFRQPRLYITRKIASSYVLHQNIRNLISQGVSQSHWSLLSFFFAQHWLPSSIYCHPLNLSSWFFLTLPYFTMTIWGLKTVAQVIAASGFEGPQHCDEPWPYQFLVSGFRLRLDVLEVLISIISPVNMYLCMFEGKVVARNGFRLVLLALLVQDSYLYVLTLYSNNTILIWSHRMPHFSTTW